MERENRQVQGQENTMDQPQQEGAMRTAQPVNPLGPPAQPPVNPPAVPPTSDAGQVVQQQQQGDPSVDQVAFQAGFPLQKLHP